MRVLLLCIAAMFMFTVVVSAEEEVGVTSGAGWVGDPGFIVDWLNDNDIDHGHLYTDKDTDTDTWRPAIFVPERRNPLGIGQIVEYRFNDTWSALAEVKRDFSNDEWSSFLMGKVVFGYKGGNAGE